MRNSGLAGSPFFIKPTIEQKAIPRYHDNMISSDNKTMVSRLQNNSKSLNQDEMIAEINKALKNVGKEASTFRLTSYEKKFIAEIIYKYKLFNIRITENDLIRIGLYILFFDYKKNRKKGIIYRIMNFQ